MRKLAAILVLASLALSSFAVIVPKGTDVRLAFEYGLSSKTARVGDTVDLRVVDDVLVDGQVVIKKGTAVVGKVSRVERGRRFGVNARVQITLQSVDGVDGVQVPIAARQKGKKTGGGTDKAAVAAGAGALVLGPVGLGIGYFVTGKDVNVKPGDTMTSEVISDTEVQAAPR